MKKLTATLIAIVAIFAAIVAWQIGMTYRENEAATRAERIQAAQLANAKQAELDRIEIQKASATAPAAAITPYLMLIVASVITAIGALVAYDRLYRRPLVAINNVPVSRNLLTDKAEETIMLTMQAIHHAAQVQIAQADAMHRLANEVKISLTTPTRAELPPPTIETLPEPAIDHAASLPENIGLAEYLHMVKPFHLAYGVLASGELLQMPIAGSYHGLRAGDTRTGKTNAIDSEIVQLHHMAAQHKNTPIRLYGADFKRELKATWQRSPLFGEIATDAPAVADMLENLVHGTDGILDRQRTFAQVGEAQNRIIRNIGEYMRVTGERLPISVFFIDEINALLESTTGKEAERVQSLLTIALQTGAASGIYIQGGAQYLTSKVMGREASKQFINRQYFGIYDPIAIRTLFGNNAEDVKPFITGQQGRGLIRTVTTRQVVAFQALRCDEQDILTAIHLHTTTTPDYSPFSVIEHTNADDNARALQSPKTLLLDNTSVTLEIPQNAQKVTVETNAINAEQDQIQPANDISPEERLQILTLAKAKISRTQISKIVYNTNNSDAYSKVKTVLDAQGATA